MNLKNIAVCILAAFLYSCSSSESKKSENPSASNEWELQILDSIQVGHLGNISTGDFSNGTGLLFDNTSNSLIKIDETGMILATQTYPKTGPNSIDFITIVKIDQQGNPYIGNYRGEFFELNEDLSFKRKIKLPFESQAFDGLMDDKSFEFWKDHIILHFPGRGEVSPYSESYLRDNYLLEMLNPTTGESSPLVRTPKTSKFSTDQLYESPRLSIEIVEDELLLYFSNEPKIHKFSLLDSGRFIETIEIQPSKFIQAPELKDKTEYYGYQKLVEGNIHGLFADQDRYVVHFSQGISEEVFSTSNFDFPADFPKLADINPSYFKIYDTKQGWSGEISIPKKVNKIFAMELPTTPFYALRNDEYLGEEQDYLTFYKLQLVQK